MINNFFHFNKSNFYLIENYELNTNGNKYYVYLCMFDNCRHKFICNNKWNGELKYNFDNEYNLNFYDNHNDIIKVYKFYENNFTLY